MQKYVSLFNKTFSFIFISFIALTLCFGRAFSIIHIGQVFITEIILFLGAIFLLLNFKEILKLPRVFLIPFSVYFIIGCLYFAKGLLEFNLYALRDIVFFGYALFLPVTFIIFSKRRLLKTFLWVLVLSNIFAVTLTRICIHRDTIWEPLYNFYSTIRPFNYLLYFGIAISFLIPLFGYLKEMKYKIPIVLLCAFNLYLIMIWEERSAWLAAVVLAVFLISLLRKKVLVPGLCLMIAFSAIFAVFAFSLDSKRFELGTLQRKATALSSFLSSKVNNPDKKISIPKYWMEEWGFEENSDVFQITEESKQDQDYLVNIGWRLEFWKQAFRSGLESPVLGKGFGKLLKQPAKWKKSSIGAYSGVLPLHNHILSVFFKMGLVGLSLFLLISVVYPFYYGFNCLRVINDGFIRLFLMGCLGALIFWHTLAFFVNVIDSPPTNIFLWVIVGLMFSCPEKETP